MDPLKTFRSIEPNGIKNLFFLFICGLSFWTSITCLLPILPAYLQDIGATARQIGWVMGCFAIGLLLSRFWLGTLADRHSRKLVVLIGGTVAGVAPLGYLWFDAISQLMFVRAFHGISIAAFTTGYSALVVDLSPPKQKGELIGYMSLAVPIGMAVGPALGAGVVNYCGYELLFAVSAGCGCLALLLASQVQETSAPVGSPSPQGLRPAPVSNLTLPKLLFKPSLTVPTVILLLIGSVFGSLVAFLPLYLRELELNFNAGLFYTAAAIASFAVRVVSGQASDRHGRGLFITISIFCYGISMILLAVGNSANTFLLAAILEGAGAGMIVPIMLALISDRCTSQERGQVFAFCVSGFDIGIALGGPVFGSFALSFGYRFLFAITAAMAVSAFLIFIAFSNKDMLNSWRFAFGNAPDFYACEDSPQI